MAMRSPKAIRKAYNEFEKAIDDLFDGASILLTTSKDAKLKESLKKLDLHCENLLRKLASLEDARLISKSDLNQTAEQQRICEETIGKIKQSMELQ
mmetsp:Transcript_197/g.310  ORF Transcript_197/g.310 Transcript_197/m.310 type:complete len:96 (+) Transcript_197:380-667(+)